jgi:hypothetical protein
MMHELQTTTADLTPPELLRRAAEILESITLSLDGIAAILERIT